MADLLTWISAIFLLMILSYLYKENPFFRFAEHTVIGAAAGYWAA